MNEGTVRQWCRVFKDRQTNVHDEERSGWPSVVSDDLVQSMDQQICDRQCFPISEFPCEFPQISRTVLYKNIAGYSVTSFVQDEFQKCSWVRTKHREWLRLWRF
jgi:hypothetical protein